jgi:hypothetical protein
VDEDSDYNDGTSHHPGPYPGGRTASAELNCIGLFATVENEPPLGQPSNAASRGSDRHDFAVSQDLDIAYWRPAEYPTGQFVLTFDLKTVYSLSATYPGGY